MNIIHNLKCWPEFFNAILRGDKTFDIRFNDRDFRSGQEIVLKEWVPNDIEHSDRSPGYTGRILHRKINYTLTGEQFGIKEGFIILNLRTI